MSSNAANSRPSLRLVNTDALPAKPALPRRHAGTGGGASGGGGGGARPPRLRDLYSNQDDTWQIDDTLVSVDEIDAAAVRRSTFKMNPGDARWVLAVRVANSLDGGRAGALPPERREKLVRFATNMGLRPFDANLVIAIVQDAARTSPLAKISTPAAALHSAECMDRLAMVPPAGAFSDKAGSGDKAALVQAVIALLVGMGVCAAMAMWFFG